MPLMAGAVHPLSLKGAKKKRGKKTFPVRDSNPGRMGENHVS